MVTKHSRQSKTGNAARLWLPLLLAAALCLPSAPQAQTAAASKNLAPGFVGLSANDKVAIVPMDVELFELTVGGVTEPKAEWTASALAHMKTAIAAKKSGLRLGVVEMTEKDADDFAEQLGLQAAVARSIAIHHLSAGMTALPTKAGELNWSLGDAMQPLAAKTGARYGLFIWVRDSYASPERKAMMVGLALLGVGVAGGVQVGYASLVDLQSGQVVWINRLLSSFGDLREAKAAQSSVDALLANFPSVR